ncbi:MAG: hypothetical protein P8016_17365 [Sedimentisphaerales bacterium]
MTGVRIIAVKAVASITPGRAREKIARWFIQNCLKSIWNAASKSKPGRKILNKSDFVRCGASKTCNSPRTSPVTTSATV